MIEFLMVPAAPTPVAPFSHAVVAEGWVFVTGQMPTDPDDTAAPLPERIEAQTRRVIENLKMVLVAAGTGLDGVVCVRVYLTHFQRDYAAMNTVYEGYSRPGGCRRGPASKSSAWRAVRLSKSIWRRAAHRREQDSLRHGLAPGTDCNFWSPCRAAQTIHSGASSLRSLRSAEATPPLKRTAANGFGCIVCWITPVARIGRMAAY